MEFPNGPVVRTWCFQYWGLNSIPGQGTINKILQAMRFGKKKKKLHWDIIFNWDTIHIPYYSAIWEHNSVIFFFFFWHWLMACGILVPWPGIEPRPWQWKCQVLTTGLPRNSLVIFRIVRVVHLSLQPSSRTLFSSSKWTWYPLAVILSFPSIFQP